jgi:hypothetical protein
MFLKLSRTIKAVSTKFRLVVLKSQGIEENPELFRGQAAFPYHPDRQVRLSQPRKSTETAFSKGIFSPAATEAAQNDAALELLQPPDMMRR